MSSVRTIARMANVSITTVSRVINNDTTVAQDTRKKVMRIANRMGYSPTIGKRVTTNVGLVYATGRIFISDFDARLLHGITQGLQRQRFNITLIDLMEKEEEETYSHFFMRKGLRGVILRTDSQRRHLMPMIAREGFPSVVVADRFEEAQVNFIAYDSRDDSRRAVRHLIDLGHRRIALGIMADQDRDHEDRLQGYLSALQEAGLPVDADLIIRLIPDLEGGASAVTRLRAMSQPPSAIYFTDPPAAMGAMRRAHEMGLRLPGDLSIVGFDDSDLRRRCYPLLTAVCQDAMSIGQRAADWLLGTIMGEVSEPCRQLLPTFFEVNQSTGPAMSSDQVA